MAGSEAGSEDSGISETIDINDAQGGDLPIEEHIQIVPQTR